jgi:hypothetical protein
MVDVVRGQIWMSGPSFSSSSVPTIIVDTSSEVSLGVFTIYRSIISSSNLTQKLYQPNQLPPEATLSPPTPQPTTPKPPTSIPTSTTTSPPSSSSSGSSTGAPTATPPTVSNAPRLAPNDESTNESSLTVIVAASVTSAVALVIVVAAVTVVRGRRKRLPQLQPDLATFHSIPLNDESHALQMQTEVNPQQQEMDAASGERWRRRR